MRHFNDLNSVSTFGFRGEALNSLCSVCDVVVVTKTNDDQLATRLEFDHKGWIQKRSQSHGNTGTRVCLSNLFCTLPVRRKDLQKNVKREYAKALEVLYAYCMISENVKFECVNQVNNVSKTIISTSANLSIFERIRSIFGFKDSENLVEIKSLVDNEENSAKYDIQGWVSKCHHGCGRSNKDR